MDVYKIGVTIALTNQVSAGLSAIARQFTTTNAQAKQLQSTLNAIKFQAVAGGLIGGLGFAGLKLTEHLVKPASEYLHQLNIMNMAGMKHAEIAEAVGDAWKNTSTVITTTATENLRMLLDLRNVIGEVNSSGLAPDLISMEAARKQLPVLSMMQSVMASSSEGGIKEIAKNNFGFSMAKALDIIGAATTPEKFETEAAMMAKVITAFQGRVTPGQFQGVFQYARQAKYGLNDEFKYEILPSLMLEASSGSSSMGGGSRGVGPMLAAFSRYAIQGLGINKKSLPELQALGLIAPGDPTKTTTESTTTGQFKGVDLARANPFEWVSTILLPAINKKFGGSASQDQVNAEIVKIGAGNQLATSLMLEFALKASNFLRDQKIIRGADDYKSAFNKAMRDDPEFAYTALAAQWTNLKTALGITIVPSIVEGLMILTRGLNELAGFFKRHEGMATALTWSFVGLSASLAFSGTVLVLTAGFRALATVLTIGGLVPAVARLVVPLTALSGLTGLAAVGAGLAAFATGLGAIMAVFYAFKPSATNVGEADVLKKFKGASSDDQQNMLDPDRWYKEHPEVKKPTGNGRPNPLMSDNFALGASGSWERKGQEDHALADRIVDGLKKFFGGSALAVTVTNGRDLADGVTKRQTDQLNRPQSGPTGPDIRQSPTFPGGLGGAWAVP